MAKNQRFLWAIAAQGPKRTFKVSLTGQNCAPNDFSQKLVDLVLLCHHMDLHGFNLGPEIAENA